VPHREALDGALVIFGGALLLTPGFITDVLGLLLLIPPTRALARRAVAGLVARRMFVGIVGRGRGRAAPREYDVRAARRDYDVEGTATETDGSVGEAPRPHLDR
jgi:UPF0716 protein FxsA